MLQPIKIELYQKPKKHTIDTNDIKMIFTIGVIKFFIKGKTSSSN